ncbi:MAG TPA: hypothetical protein DCE56_19935 [Cyanobacteria bacterium UBA8553]|nr:hypothetical protein [Cyanobacteria bacterium UBA8553]HAJ60790.1 hypothetical protein [Cyanobacteria bacterium UBA8543]
MQSDLGALHITAEEIEDLVDLNPSKTLAVDAYRAFILKRPKSIFSVFLTELFAFCLLLTFVMPISLLLLRNVGKLPEDTAGIIRLSTVILGLCLLSIPIGNIYLWKQAKTVKSLAKLMDEVDKYNGVIQAITLVDEIELAVNSTTQLNHLNNRQEVVTALKVTKDSLISALRVERIIRRHKRFVEGRYELLANIENNLNTLLSFEASNQASEYGRLLNESLQIGMSVHKEVRKLQNQKF